jgi:hypothetical protein
MLIYGRRYWKRNFATNLLRFVKLKENSDHLKEKLEEAAWELRKIEK